MGKDPQGGRTKMQGRSLVEGSDGVIRVMKVDER